MALDTTLDFNFNAVQQASITGELDALLAVLNDPSVPYVNLTAKERKTPSIETKRLPYVKDAVENHLPAFPALASGSITLARTTTLWQLDEFLRSIKPKIAEISDRFKDLELNAENIVYKSMGDSYDTAVRQEGRMPGADVLKAALSPLFAKQGNPTEEPKPEQPIPPPPVV